MNNSSELYFEEPNIELFVEKLKELSARVQEAADTSRFLYNRSKLLKSNLDKIDIEKVIKLLNETLHDCPISEIDTKLKEKIDDINICKYFN